MTIISNNPYALKGSQVEDLATRMAALRASCQAKALTGATAPTTETEGELGQLYVQDNGDTYILVSIDEESESGVYSYTWVSSGGDAPIESISVNGTVVAPDANKNVDLTIDEGIKTLTAEDYDYHDSGSEDNSVALWRLPAGIYLKPEGINAHIISSAGGRLWDNTQNAAKIAIVTPTYGTGLVGVTVFGGGLLLANSYSRILRTSGAPQSVPNNENYYRDTILLSSYVVDDLTTSSSQRPLSADQGRILNNNIGDLTTLTTATKTSTVAAINELKGLVDSLESVSFSVVSTLPATGEANVIYLVPNEESGEESGAGNFYEEYVWIDSESRYEIIGTTDIDLSGYTPTADLAQVALSNSYNDLDDKPTIPTVNDATLTVQQNGTSVGTFTANSSTNTTVNITAPVITMTDTDPGEGSPLAQNNFVAYYIEES